MKDVAKYRAYRHWADQYNDQAKIILARYVLKETDPDMDMHEACDLVTFSMQPGYIGIRMRQARYVQRYGWDFTLRCETEGTETELHKIQRGFGDWLFYGFAAERGIAIARWFLIDLNALRRFLFQHPKWYAHECFREFDNHDGSKFRAFDVRKLPPEIIIASSMRIPRGRMP